METAAEKNPDALTGAAPPTVTVVDVDGTHIYTELRGRGAPVLIVGAADEDAEVYRGVAERLAATHTVVTYDRRGTGRSGRDGWPADSAGHADDAAAVLSILDLEAVTVLGASAGGVVALRLALRHPERLATVLCFEPGAFRIAGAEGDAFRARTLQAVEEHLRSHPGDWEGAADALGKAAAGLTGEVASLFAAPPGRNWFARRTRSAAESLIRGDLALTGEDFDHDDVANCPLVLRFSHGTESLTIFATIAARLAAIRGEEPDVLPGVGHGIFYRPDRAVGYILGWA